MNLTHEEINFLRLLSKCEEMADGQEFSNWRYGSYITSLETLLKQLNSLTSQKPSPDTLKRYSKKIDFLKHLLQLNVESNQDSKSSLFDDRVKPVEIQNPGPLNTKKDLRSKQIYHRAKLTQEDVLRKQLFGSSVNQKDNQDEQESEALNQLLAKEQEAQEKVANQMLKSVKAIKEHSLLANRILKTDNKILGELTSNAEKNVDNLKVLNERLNSKVTRSCNCWIVVVIFLTLLVFVAMVLFMKLFPKRKDGSSNLDYHHHQSSQYTHYLNNNTITIDNQTMHLLEL